jgi:hypothetical protein
MVSKSRFSRRLHRIKEIFIVFFNLWAQIWKTLNPEAIYVIGSSTANRGPRTTAS